MKIKNLLILLSVIFLQSCASSPKMSQELQQGKATFTAGNYPQAFHQLLAVAINGNKEAQYAVGYMYYNGVGVAQDAQAGILWMKKSADQHYPPAINALKLLKQSQN